MVVSGQYHAPNDLFPERNPGPHWIGRWVGPIVRLDTFEKKKIS